MSGAPHGSAIPRHVEHPQKTPRHMADVCRGRSSTPHLALPRRRSLHPLSRGECVCPFQLPLGGNQCCICLELLTEGNGRLSGVAAELFSYPPRERDIQIFDDRHNVIRDADRLVRHVRIIRTCVTPAPAVSRVRSAPKRRGRTARRHQRRPRGFRVPRSAGRSSRPRRDGHRCLGRGQCCR